MRSSRILVLNERDLAHPKAGGAEIHVAEIFRRLAALGHEVTLAASSFKGCKAEDTIDGMRVWRLGGIPIYYPRVAYTTARETRRGNFDVVVECLNKVPFYSPVYSSVPVLAICHHLFGEVAFQQVPWPVAATVWAAERFIPPLYKKPNFVAISESSRTDLIHRGIDADRVRVSHCGIEPTEVEVNVDTPRSMRVAYVGRLETYKNVDIMLRACAELTGRFPELEIVVIGRGVARDSLESLARELGIADRTRFTGFVSNLERDELLAATRVCVCPSEKEGWGLTIIESNALGTPVVATDADGLRDSVRDGETGFLVKSRDVVSFRARISELLEDDDLAIQMSKRALAWSKTFDWDTSANEMASAIEDARQAP
ncbi:MAG: glycosyltransferase involved in cell wall biosynthesis [Myxococcota bacterium]|jgi:glycosyltransferase involved in cell wall biosynthesis